MRDQVNLPEHPESGAGPATIDRARRPRRFLLPALIFVLVVLALGGWGIFSRLRAESRLKAETAEMAIPVVLVGKAERGPAVEELVLPGTVQANFETPVYARTSGYLKAWYADIGTPVKAGQRLAEIDTPDVDDQLRQAEADLATSEANNQLAQITAKRWLALLATDSVSKQETDEKIGAARADAALVNASRANVARLRELEGFKHVVAPFSGVVTARETDVGALINAGGTGRELFRVADNSKLRIYVQVPQTYSASIKPGMVVDLRFAEHPGQIFHATLVRTSQALDPTARTLLIELQADNRGGQLIPGGYTEVHIRLPAPYQTTRLPVSALLFRADGLSVGTVGAIGNDGRAHANLHRITVGRDFGTNVEVLTGLDPDQAIIIDPPDSLLNDEVVRVQQPPKTGQAAPNAAKG